MRALLAQQPAIDGTRQPAQALARHLVERLRGERSQASGIDALMHEFSLSSDEGVALMCLAEALLRIPDNPTRDRLIADKIGRGNWRNHLGASPSLFVNAAAWGLLITGRLVATHSEHGLGGRLNRLLARGGEPVVRAGVDLAMRLLGKQFVCGESIDQALENSRPNQQRGYRYSYDMLGEAALTEDDAQACYQAYQDAIHAIGAAAAGRGVRAGPGVSVKLSALHPRYCRAQRERVLSELLPRLRELAVLARGYGIGLNIDAEESDRLELSMALLERLAFDASLRGFDGIGFVVQAYQKRCPFVISWLADLARRSGQRFMVRLVKGAYWDAEIKRAQVDGMPGYPVFTRKEYTDVCYLVCARKLLAHHDLFYPQFATHNAHTLATIHHWAQETGVDDFEFQCLHGMGESLYDQVIGAQGLGRACRIYAPVGSHQTLLAYLVRRLLENGANSSFVNRLLDQSIAVEELIADPFDAARALEGEPHPAIPLPQHLFGNERRNSAGIDLNSDQVLDELAVKLQAWSTVRWQVQPLVVHTPSTSSTSSSPSPSAFLPVLNPADHGDRVADVLQAQALDVGLAAASAQQAAAGWVARAAGERSAILSGAADLLQENMPELLALIVREAGRTLPAAVGEVREAIDFLRYYAVQSRRLGARQPLGVVACISPWNFPLAIFVGQVSAALAAGNAVLAKPAEQTPATAALAVRLLHQAGVPQAVLQLLPGTGEAIGAALVANRQIDGVMFTGSTEVAARIQARLLQRAAEETRVIPLVAETGGQNVMLVDSSALPEQVVQDALVSAFDSGGQRCSALRVLCLQEEIADRVLTMLRGAVQEWRLGRPDRLDVDVGPVIDRAAQEQLRTHVEKMRARGLSVWELALPDGLPSGSYFPPTVIGIDSLDQLDREVFGPVLHVLRYRREQLPTLLQAVKATGYGLTLGIHTRIDETIETVVRSAQVGNIYVNRNMIGAVVGVQPFGGMGKSGTGPKAGGPHYLLRLVRDSPGQDPAQEIQLPGPTGESSSLRWRPRGPVLCISDDSALLLRMIRLVLDTGNQPLLLAWQAAAAQGVLLPVWAQVGITGTVGQLSGPPAEAMILADQPALPGLASHEFKDGPPLIFPVIAGVLPPRWMMRAEQTVTINTAAAGGNAALLRL